MHIMYYRKLQYTFLENKCFIHLFVCFKISFLLHGWEKVWGKILIVFSFHEISKAHSGGPSVGADEAGLLSLNLASCVVSTSFLWANLCPQLLCGSPGPAVAGPMAYLLTFNSVLIT